jgi:hypothetical protein
MPCDEQGLAIRQSVVLVTRRLFGLKLELGGGSVKQMDL